MKEIVKQGESLANDDIVLSEDGQYGNNLSDDELAVMTDLMKEYIIPTPDEKIIDQTVNYLTQMLRFGSQGKTRHSLVMRLLQITSHILQYSGKWYIALCLVLYSIALAVTLADRTINPCAPSIILGPVPFLLAVAGAFRSSDARMAELEMSFKYSLKQLIMTRLLLAAIFNTVCNVMISLILSGAYLAVDPIRLVFIWCAPFMLVSSVSLCIVIKIRGYYVSLACLGLWSAISVSIAFNSEWLEFLTLYVKTELYIIITVISFVILVYDVTVLLSKTIERGDFFDTFTKKHIKTVQG